MYYSVCWRLWRVGSVSGSVVGAGSDLPCAALYVEAVEGGLSLRDVLEVLEVPEAP